MAELEILAQQQTITRKGDGIHISARGTRDGSLFTADWFQALALEGRVFAVNSGTGTAPTTFGGAYSATDVDLGIDVPDATAIMPITIEVNLQTTGASLFEVIMLASRSLQATTGGVTLTPVALRTDAPNSTNTTVIGTDGSVTATDPNTTGAYEFYRSGYPTDPDVAGNPNPRYAFSALRDGVFPLIVGEGSIAVYASGTSGTGFITAIWAELPETAIV